MYNCTKVEMSEDQLIVMLSPELEIELTFECFKTYQENSNSTLSYHFFSILFLNPIGRIWIFMKRHILFVSQSLPLLTFYLTNVLVRLYCIILTVSCQFIEIYFHMLFSHATSSCCQINLLSFVYFSNFEISQHCML
jgi:hypothetical protein